MKSIVVFVVSLFIITPVLAGDWDKIKEKTQEVLEKTEENIEEAKNDIQKAAEVATEQAQEAIDKNEDGTKRLFERAQVNSERVLNDIKEGVEQAAKELEEFFEEVKTDLKDDKPKTNIKSTAAVEFRVKKEAELQPLPNVDHVRFVSQDEQMKESFFKYLSEKMFYTHSRDLTYYVVILHEDARLFPIASEDLDLTQPQILLDQMKSILGESASTLTLKSTGYILEDGSILIVHNFSL